ncbi:SH3 domain-containing protein [Tessaracoccus sp.]
MAVAGLMQSVGSMAFGPVADASSGQMTATTAVNVRAAASSTSARLGILYRGEKIQAVSSGNGWTTVTHRGKKAYVASSYLSSGSAAVVKPSAPSSPSKTGTVYSTSPNLNLRSGPTLSYPIQKRVTKGSKLSLTGAVSGSYSQVVHNGKTVWAATLYLSTTAAAPTQSLPASVGKVRATAALMIRTTSDRNFKSLGDVPRGTTLEVTGVVQGGLAQVLWQGNVRWVNNSYVTPVGGATTAPAVPTPPKTTTQYATANLNVWGAATGAAHSGEIAFGSAVQVTGTVASGRAQVVLNGATRWVTAKYLSTRAPGATAPAVPAPPKTTTQYAKADLNLWAAATGASYSGEIPVGSAVQVTGAVASGRAQVVHNGATRWVTAKYLSASKPAAPGTSKPNPPQSGGSGGGTLNRGYSSGLDQTNDSIKKVVRHVWASYPAIKTMYGWRRDVTPDHPGGRAVDVMIPSYKTNSATGWQIAEYFRANAAQFNITYIIFDQKIWSVSRNSEGWRNMASRGGDTANHKDHVHINA